MVFRRTSVKKTTFRRKTLPKRARAARVAKARMTPAKVRSIAKKAVLTVTEKHCGQWRKESVVTPNARADQVRTMNIFRNSDMYPAQGDARTDRTGQYIQALYYKIFFALKSNIAQEPHTNPVDIYLVRLARQQTQSSNVLVQVQDIWREAYCSDTVTWVNGIPCITGPMDPGYGQVVKKWRVSPQRTTYPQEGNWQAVNGSAQPVDTDIEPEYRTFQVSVPINKRLRFNGASAEFPDQLPHYVLLFHNPNNYYSTNNHWVLEYCYTQFHFKDV